MPKLTILLDVGTTTLSGALLDVAGDRILSKAITLNKQARFGDDLISRIDFALKERKNPDLLQKQVLLSINRIIRSLLNTSSKKGRDVDAVLCVCNSTMHHFIIGIDTRSLITPPYRAAQRSETTINAEMLGVKLCKGTPVTFLPNIGGFVGSDALSVILASQIYQSKEIKLAIDIGTNGEIILGNRKRILVASTAAGPAFEARYIKSGMPAVKGAIESVRFYNNKIEYKVIGSGSPKGIAGSGLIDLCYEMFRTGAMDRSGRMKENEFIVYKRGSRKVSITQNDIRKLQLAKAAIFAGIKILLKRYGIDSSSLDQILLTGSFGSHLNAKSVIGVGLIPNIDIKKVTYLHDGPINGLRLYATEPLLHKKILSILSRVEHVNLIGRGFGEEFATSIPMGQPL